MSPELSIAGHLPQISTVGKQLHRRGPAAAKLLRVHGTASVLLDVEWRERRPCSETSRMLAVRYVGAFEAHDCPRIPSPPAQTDL